MTETGIKTLVSMIESMSRINLHPHEVEAWRFMMAQDDDAQVLNRLVEFYRSPTAGMRRQGVPLPGDLIDQPKEIAALAAAVLRDSIARYGHARSVRFQDGRINAAIQALGGWVELCAKETEELDRIFAFEFPKLYSAVAPSFDRLPGFHEILNSANGHKVTHETVEVLCPWIESKDKNLKSREVMALAE